MKQSGPQCTAADNRTHTAQGNKSMLNTVVPELEPHIATVNAVTLANATIQNTLAATEQIKAETHTNETTPAKQNWKRRTEIMAP